MATCVVKDFSVWKQTMGLFAFIILVFAVSFIGSVGSFQSATFYMELNQPSFAPPSWLFGPVWSVLYLMIAIAAFVHWLNNGFIDKPTKIRAKISYGVFLTQLLLNGTWSWVFFYFSMGGLALVNIALLWLSIMLNIIVFYRVNKTAGLLLVPYLAWVSFASVLNYYMWQLNPSVLG